MLEMILKGEDSFTEFKEERVHPDELAAEMVAFSNSEGGTLLVGVSDRGEILGLTDWDKTMQRIDNVANHNCEPPVFFVIEKVVIEGKHVLVVKFSQGAAAPLPDQPGGLLYPGGEQ
ncbi:MAG: ATP-binding protein [Firmicutes bacterium]|nr:ATP-binding protein [Bacillota bacterium]